MSEVILRQEVETLYQHAADSRQEFCIPLEGEAPNGQLLWQWAHLHSSGTARRSVERKQHLIEGEHYLLCRSEKQVPHQGGMRSQETVTIWFSVEGFELWLLMLDTPRGHEIRQFFRECHKRIQLEMSQPTAFNAELAKLTRTVSNGLAGLYGSQHELKEQVAVIGDGLEEVRQDVLMLKEQALDQLYVFCRSKDMTLMLGHTTELSVRRKVHEKRGFQFIGTCFGTRQEEKRIKQALRRRGFPPKNGTEEYQLTPEAVEAFAQEGLPIGALSCSRIPNVPNSRKGAKVDTVTPSLF